MSDVTAFSSPGSSPGSILMSERDVVRVVAAGKHPAAVPTVDVASTKLMWCDAEATVDQVAARMTGRYIRHLLVQRDGALAGIVLARDPLGVYSAYSASADLGAVPDLDSL
jgi:CBS domain-containing protein